MPNKMRVQSISQVYSGTVRDILLINTEILQASYSDFLYSEKI